MVPLGRREFLGGIVYGLQKYVDGARGGNGNNLVPLSAEEALARAERAISVMLLEGLFTTDDQDETSGISDDTMRGCPPQAFYQLVPTLFQQMVIACKSGALS